MPRPALDPVALELLSQTEPLARGGLDHDYAFEWLVAAIGSMWQSISDVTEDTLDRPGWSSLVDYERVPTFAIPWLAQVAGVRLTLGAPEAVHREEIVRADGQKRGRPSAILRAAQHSLTGSRYVYVFERNGGSAWHLRVVTLVSETPDPAKTEAEIRAAVPIGIVVEVTTVSTLDDVYNTLWLTHQDYNELDEIYDDYNEAASDSSKRP